MPKEIEQFWKLKAFIRKSGYSLEEFGVKVWGLHRSNTSEYLNGKKEMRLSMITAAADFLKMDKQQILELFFDDWLQKREKTA